MEHRLVRGSLLEPQIKGLVPFMADPSGRRNWELIPHQAGENSPGVPEQPREVEESREVQG